MLCKNTSIYDFFFKTSLYKLYIVNRNCIFYGIFIEQYICYNLNSKRNAVGLQEVWRCPQITEKEKHI